MDGEAGREAGGSMAAKCLSAVLSYCVTAWRGTTWSSCCRKPRPSSLHATSLCEILQWNGMVVASTFMQLLQEARAVQPACHTMAPGSSAVPQNACCCQYWCTTDKSHAAPAPSGTHEGHAVHPVQVSTWNSCCRTPSSRHVEMQYLGHAFCQYLGSINKSHATSAPFRMPHQHPFAWKARRTWKIYTSAYPIPRQPMLGKAWKIYTSAYPIPRQPMLGKA